jgi:hypothetical protein
VIELLLEAERVRLAGELDRAELLFRQVAEADPQNAIAVVGLAEVALDRGDAAAGLAYARRALEIDPQEAAARRIVDDLAAVAAPSSEVEAPVETEPAETEELSSPEPEAPTRRSWFRRLLDRLFGRR